MRPLTRYGHTAVWTGSEMIVWGGVFVSNIGGRYNPSTDTWTATSSINAPHHRADHTAVWTGTEMIIWGADSYAAHILHTVGDTIPAQIVGQPPGRHVLPGTVIPQCGPAVR